jgi:hypothetical protein
MNHLGVQGVTDVSSRQVNACIAAADGICAALRTEDRHAAPGAGYEAWATSDDVGQSSYWLARVLLGHGYGTHAVTPLDAADWWRCCHMLACCPELRANLTGGLYYLGLSTPVWRWIAAHWEYAEWLLAVDPARMTAELVRVRQEVKP